MKALTVQQPWAWAIVEYDKVENRSWSTQHRGTLAIHAGAKVDPRGLHDPEIERATGDASFFDDDPTTYEARGAVIGVADLVDVHEATSTCVTGECSPWGWFCWEDDPEKPMYHWVFANQRRLRTPVACKGALQLWVLPAEVRDAVLEQLVEATA